MISMNKKLGIFYNNIYFFSNQCYTHMQKEYNPKCNSAWISIDGLGGLESDQMGNGE